MLKACKGCIFYNEDDNEIYGMMDDEIIIDDPNPPHPYRRYCKCWGENCYIIPKEVCQNKVKCPHYVIDPELERGKHKIVIIKVIG